MSVRDSVQLRLPDRGQGSTETDVLRPGSGVGAASAMERVKAERALRKKFQHGIRPSLPSEDDESSVF